MLVLEKGKMDNKDWDNIINIHKFMWKCVVCLKSSKQSDRFELFYAEMAILRNKIWKTGQEPLLESPDLLAKEYELSFAEIFL